MPAGTTKKIRIYEKKQVMRLNSTGELAEKRKERSVFQAHCPYCTYKSPMDKSRVLAGLDVIRHIEKKHPNKTSLKEMRYKVTYERASGSTGTTIVTATSTEGAKREYLLHADTGATKIIKVERQGTEAGIQKKVSEGR